MLLRLAKKYGAVAVFLCLLSFGVLAQGPSGLGISLVQDIVGNIVAPARQMTITCGATVSSGGTGTGIVNVAMGPVNFTTKTAAYTIPASACGSAYNNTGATGSVTLTLPAAAPGLNYFFTVDAAQTLEVLGAGTDQIAIGASNSSSNNVTANATYATLWLYAYKAGQWVAISSTGTWTVH